MHSLTFLASNFKSYSIMYCDKSSKFNQSKPSASDCDLIKDNSILAIYLTDGALHAQENSPAADDIRWLGL